MHGMAPLACTEEQEDGDGEVAEGARALMAGTPFSAIVSRGCGVVSYVNRCSFLRTAFACIFAHYNTFVRILAHSIRAAF